MQAFRHNNTRKRCTHELSVLVILDMGLLLFVRRDANQSLTSSKLRWYCSIRRK
jgi:hypothetical protein